MLFDVGGFWDPLVAQLDRMAGAGLLAPANRAIVRLAVDGDSALAALAAALPAGEAVISPEQT